MKKNVALLLVLVLTISSIVSVLPVKAEYQHNITINANGSISPTTAPIKQTDDTYVLTEDLKGSLTVRKSNIVLNGNGHTIMGEGQGTGIGGILIGSLPTTPTSGLFYTSNVTVENFTVTGSVYGISLWACSNVTVTNNTVTETGNGLLSLDEPTAGIDVEGGGSNLIIGNNLESNYFGIRFLETVNNRIIGNNVTNSYNPGYPYLSGCGIIFWGASNNTIYHNNFVKNDIQVLDYSFSSPFSSNNWNVDDVGGNYWDDYVAKYPNATEIDDSGIGDTVYVIDLLNKDYLPLMEPFTFTPPEILVLSPLNQSYNESSVSLVFAIDKAANWTGYSLDGNQNVTVTGNNTINRLTSGIHTVTVYANDTYGNMGVSETVDFTIAERFPTALIVAASGVSITVIVVGLLVYFKKRKR